MCIFLRKFLMEMYDINRVLRSLKITFAQARVLYETTLAQPKGW